MTGKQSEGHMHNSDIVYYSKTWCLARIINIIVYEDIVYGDSSYS